ncbi:Serpentine receptor class epsilon-1 [Caenorhabditis elegans]|uniref:Serpentine receptor class epsilon-1 n=1 Tax=Caenorhabditis elegans TaxID=6239 RepID=SRE1_CAEEL|nr:Serpentine receptor class epsilon-1 [Caenorhabditis elegans]Q09213.2 RecName: Full=Serpentine receptor class epsilon-1; Short=Protein sre-1 [Caenorhabditis elegans]pir/G88216/ protein B0495.1 [imported] - Caenorhabditis elegans [Caenorhabditis elegans]CCD61470.1 Serpentine receptor class epsilon-1 [Caenorhabditis elegans]|eukprot:NP_495621.2 Serpentine receptor class epsilon-1 [Caenorhabditis elegans]
MNLQYSPVFKCPPEMVTHCQWIYWFTHFELLAMIIEIPSFLLVIYATIKSPFHYNLNFIGLFMLLGYYVFLVGRFITCLYEIGSLTVKDEDAENEIYPMPLILSSILQFFYMGCACGISLAVAFERFFATYFVETYEKKKRKWISLFLCSEFTVACGVSAIVMLYDLLPFAVMAFLGVFISCASFLFYLVLFYMNKRRLHTIQQDRDNDVYTLSVRFQLSENLKVMTLLRNVVLFSGVNNFVMAIILTMYMSKSFKVSYPLATLYLHFAFNCCVLLYSFLMLIIIIFSVKQYRMYYFSIRFVRVVLYPLVGRCFQNEFSQSPVQQLTIRDETESYFVNLSSQWDEKFQKINRLSI